MPLRVILTESDWAAFAHLITLSVRGDGWAGYGLRHPPGCMRHDDGWKCDFTDALHEHGGARTLPERLGVYAATVENGLIEFAYVRALNEGDRHG
jgi:hypothetical protein